MPWSIRQSPAPIAAAFLRGLFDADGCVVHNQAKGSYVGLGSVSNELLREVQILLTTFGVSSRIYKVHDGSMSGHLPYTNKDGEQVSYGRSPSYDLRVTSASIGAFAQHIGFSLSRKSALLSEILFTGLEDHGGRGFYDVRRTTACRSGPDGVELTYNLSEPRNHCMSWAALSYEIAPSTCISTTQLAISRAST